MAPNKKYEVLQAFDLGGTVQEVGSVVELSDADAAQYLESNVIKEVDGGENSDGSATVPNAPDAPQGDGNAEEKAPENTTATPGEPEAGRGETPNSDAEPKAEKKQWVGNHTVGGNEQAQMRTPHPDLSGKKA